MGGKCCKWGLLTDMGSGRLVLVIVNVTLVIFLIILAHHIISKLRPDKGAVEEPADVNDTRRQYSERHEAVFLGVAGDRPYTCILINIEQTVCTGTIISRRWIFADVECAVKVTDRINREHYAIYTGFNKWSDESRTKYGVSRWHKGSSSPDEANRLAVFMTSKDISFDESTQPLKLASILTTETLRDSDPLLVLSWTGAEGPPQGGADGVGRLFSTATERPRTLPAERPALASLLPLNRERCKQLSPLPRGRDLRQYEACALYLASYTASRCLTELGLAVVARNLGIGIISFVPQNDDSRCGSTLAPYVFASLLVYEDFIFNVTGVEFV